MTLRSRRSDGGTAGIGAAEGVTTLMIRAAVPGDMTALCDVFRRSSLSSDGDQENLLTSRCPGILRSGSEPGRTRVAVADGRIVGFATRLSTGQVMRSTICSWILTGWGGNRPEAGYCT
jgi:hypothetical protein